VTCDRGAWSDEFLAEIAAPTSVENRVAMLTWIASERGYSEAPIAAAWNPLDTTMPRKGATDYNDAGVKNYASWDDGIGATVATIKIDGYGYPAIIAAFRSNADAEHIVRVIDASSWGSHPSSEMVAYIRAHYDEQVALFVGECSPGPVPPPPTILEDDNMVILLCDGANPLLVTADGQRGWEVSDPGTVPTAHVTSDQRAYIVQQLHT
jgi:hypothetical protein